VQKSARLAARIVGGAVLLGAVVWYARPRALVQELARIDAAWFALAVLAAIMANVVSAWRWAAIARALDLVAPTGRLILMYARGVTTNLLLPGATLSGDLLRSYQLASLGNPFLRCALSVFFDRLSGLWVLCVLSLLSALIALAVHHAVLPDGVGWYVLTLVAAIAAPLIRWPTKWLQRLPIAAVRQLGVRVDALHARLRMAAPALRRSALVSIGVQILSSGTLWICAFAVGVQLSYWTMLAAAAPIFIMAAVPLGVAGFGTRELAAVIVLGYLGVSPQQATATSLLYGLCGVVQGVLAAPLFLRKA
jgi:glycosyltransferase 2 family protein